MLPAEWGDLFDHIRRRGDAFPVELGERLFEIESIPVDDGIDEQVQPARPENWLSKVLSRSSPRRLKNSARASVFWASLLLRPAVAQRALDLPSHRPAIAVTTPGS
jgi:hypothetical protein